MTDLSYRLLLLSNSTIPGQGFLEYAEDALRDFLGSVHGRLLFVPFAGVRISYDDYAERVKTRFAQLGLEVESIHRSADPQRAVEEAGAVVVGGGNTFHLLRELTGLLPAIRARVEAGVPYVGWSAGANLACPTIRTTNDMPIVEPPSFEALGLVPFQINPHYTDAHPPGHGGETRAERIAEFVAANPEMPVIGLPEGTMLRVEGGRMALLGERPARLFRHGAEPEKIAPGEGIEQILPLGSPSSVVGA